MQETPGECRVIERVRVRESEREGGCAWRRGRPVTAVPTARFHCAKAHRYYLLESRYQSPDSFFIEAFFLFTQKHDLSELFSMSEVFLNSICVLF